MHRVSSRAQRSAHSTDLHAYVCAHAHTYTYTYTYTHMHTRNTGTHTHTHKHACTDSMRSQLRVRAGMGGLATAAQLVAKGARVVVLEK